MLQPARPNASRVPVALSKSLPPPVGGLNARDPLQDMEETDALILDNFFPEPNDVPIRKGYLSHATGIGAAVRSLFEYAGPTSRKMFAAKSTDIYDVTSSGAVGAAAVSSLTSGDWQSTMMANSGGNHLLIANGVDSIRAFDGTSWSTPAITGVTSSTISNLAVHKKRLWMVQINTTDAWYLDTEAIAGAASKFPIGAQFKKGGKLVAIGTWTRDGGNGPDDFAAFVSSMGEVAVYEGTDPASASTWSLVGVYTIPPPIGNRCLLNLGTDLIIVTAGGAISLTAVMGGVIGGKAAISDKINKLFNVAAVSYGANFGWQAIYYPNGHRAMINVPVAEGTTQHQYVMNTLTGAWSRFTGMNANCWALLNDNLYFGGNGGTVYRADTGYRDNTGGITADMKTSFNYHGTKGLMKIYSMVRSIYTSSGSPSILLSLNVDFSDTQPTDSLTASPSNGSQWGTAKWGSGKWGGSNEIHKEWQGVTGMGVCAAIRKRVQVNGASYTTNAFEVMFTRGAML